MHKGSIYLSVGGIVLGLTFYISSLSIRQAVALSSSPVEFPRFISALIIITSLLLLVREFVCARREKKEATSLHIANPKIVLGVAGGMVLYVVLLNMLGFIPCTFLYLFGTTLILTLPEKNIWKNLLYSAVLTGVIYVMFDVAFGATLPVGSIWMG